MFELLEARGLMLERIGSRELIPSEVLEAAQRRTLNWPRIATPGRAFAQRKFRRNVKDLKTLSESVLPSRAIRFIRNAVASLDYGVQLKKVNRKDKELQKQVSPLIDKVLGVFDNPNTNDDDLQSFVAQIVEDVLVFDAGVWEYVEKPKFIPNNNLLALEVVPGFSLASKLDWDGNPAKPRWMQVMDDNREGETFLDSEIEYLSMRKRSWTPFGLSPLETVIDIMEAWLGIASYQRRVASEAYPPILLHLGGQPDEVQLNLVRSWWENDIKGRATPGFLGWQNEVNAIDMKPGGDAGLMLAYQEMLVRTISFAFDLKPLDFSIERDVNRTTAEVQRISSLRDGPKTLARLLQAKMNQRVLPKLAELLNDPLVLKLEFFWMNIDPADDKAQAEVYKILCDSEIMFPDEARAELDLEQRTDGLGMLSVNALKELYTINPTAGMKTDALKNGTGLPDVPTRTPDLNQEVGLTQNAAAQLIRDLRQASNDQIAPLLQRVNEIIAAKTLEVDEPQQGDVHHHNVTVNPPAINVTIPDIHVPQPHIIVNAPPVHVEPQVEIPIIQDVKRRVERDADGRITGIIEERSSQSIDAITKRVVRRNSKGQIEEISEE